MQNSNDTLNSLELLLNREEIVLDKKNIEKHISHKKIVVTGGAGSIGSELVKQILSFKPKLLVIVDQAESNLYELVIQLNEDYQDTIIKGELIDITQKNLIEKVFKNYKPDLLFHAAAYKQVPVIENNPIAAVIVNIIGTINLVNLALQYKTQHFVFISTDKAVNPTNVMGATKRAAEIYMQSIQAETGVKTTFITTRFGNVIGSNGSVIPRFKKQIAKGGPITVTHPDIIRYFMTITEACQLVLQAGSMGKGGEIYVFDMGKPVKIMDLAVRMIKLSGLIPNEDIKIEVTGLRPGEKLFEELLADSSINLPTHHEKIMVAKDIHKPFSKIKTKFAKLIKVALNGEDDKVVSVLKEIVPEFKSENSKFSHLDK